MKTNSHWKSAFLTALLTLLTAGASLAQQMNYQGRLTDSAGNAVPDAQYSITFDIFDSANGGTNKWGPQVIPADVVQGRFNVILGPTDTASRNIVSAFDGGTRYLQITYQSNPILPRQQILSSPTAFYSQTAGQLANVFVLNGNVGIGTQLPTQAKLVVNGTSSTGTSLGALGFLSQSGTVGTSPGVSANLSIYTSGSIAAGSAYFCFSDERIKRVKGRSDAVADLALLQGIVIMDYSYIDTVSKDGRKHKKLIGEKEEAIHEVLEVRDGAFRTAFQSATNEVFVYGREVKDFRSVDYDAIAMLNVSATQQIKKEKDAEIKALQEENAVLKAALTSQDKRVTALEAKNQARDVRLASIEKLLESPDQPVTRTVSFKAE